MDLIINKKRIGVCVDTCHIHDAGYDIVNKYGEVKAEMFTYFSLSDIKVIHLNDSKNNCGAHKDRHANIGEGYIGFDTLKEVCDDQDFALIPKILETPYIDGMPPYQVEINLLKR